MSWMFFLVDLVGNVMEELIEISYFRSVSGGKAKSAKSLAWVCVFLAIFKLVPRMLGNVQMLNRSWRSSRRYPVLPGITERRYYGRGLLQTAAL